MNRLPFVISASLAFWMVLGGVSRAAIIHTETGDASEMPPAQSTGSGPLNIILGNLGSNDRFTDVDVFAIKIIDAALFSATVVSADFDTQLFLFDQNGVGVVANDDALPNPDPTLLSMIPPASGFIVVSPGLYFLAIAEFPDQPVNASGFMFQDPAGVGYSPTAVVGPVGLDPITGWAKAPGPHVGGSYEILLTAAEGAQLQSVVPEPSSFAMMLSFVSLAAVTTLRRRRPQSVRA